MRIHQAWSVSEGDVCEWLLDFILVIFVVICVYFTYHLIFDFSVWFTLSTPQSEMFKVWSQMSDTNIDRENPSDIPALVFINNTHDYSSKGCLTPIIVSLDKSRGYFGFGTVMQR